MRWLKGKSLERGGTWFIESHLLTFTIDGLNALEVPKQESALLSWS